MTHQAFRDLCQQVGGQRAASRLLGCNERTVRRWCSGETRKIPAEAMDRLREAADTCRHLHPA